MSVIELIEEGDIHKLFQTIYEDIPRNIDSLREFHNKIKSILILIIRK